MADKPSSGTFGRIMEPLGIALIGVVLLAFVLGLILRSSTLLGFSATVAAALTAFLLWTGKRGTAAATPVVSAVHTSPPPSGSNSVMAKSKEEHDMKDHAEESFVTDSYSESAMQMLDDTQASVIFNQTSDAIIDIIHQTFQAHSTVFYLYNEFENEIVLQSFRSSSKRFNTISRHALGQARGTLLFKQVVQTGKPVFVADGSEDIGSIAYYSDRETIHSLILLPLFHKDTRIGLLSVDHLRAEAFSERHVGLLEQYGELIVSSIQTIDAVYLKNKLRRMFQSLREYTENVVLQSDEEKVLHSIRLMVNSNLQCDQYSLWLNTGNGEEAMVFESTEQSGVETGTTVPLGSSLVGQAMSRLKRIYLGDYELHRSSEPGAASEPHLPSVLVVPLVDQGYCFGTLVIESKERNAFNSYEIQFVESLCHSAALAMSRFRLDHHLAKEITYDPLTGIDNVHAFRQKLQDEIHRAKRFGTTFTVVLCEVTSLKAIYEKEGVNAGDFVLEKVAEIVKNSLRQIDSVARVATDRFGLILLEARRSDAFECAQRILRNCESADVKTDGANAGAELSIGIAIFSADGDSPDALIEGAEKALSVAKKSSSPKITFCS